MAHKGYTLNYFINFFKSIPDHQWCTFTEQKEGTIQHCAVGHVLRDNRSTLSDTRTHKTARLNALQDFLGVPVENINDDVKNKYGLGTTPRGRVLRALRNRKRHGSFRNSDSK